MSQLETVYVMKGGKKVEVKLRSVTPEEVAARLRKQQEDAAAAEQAAEAEAAEAEAREGEPAAT